MRAPSEQSCTVVAVSVDVARVFPGLEHDSGPAVEGCAHLILEWVDDADIDRYVNDVVLPAAGVTPRQLAEQDPTALVPLLVAALVR